MTVFEEYCWTAGSPITPGCHITKKYCEFFIAASLTWCCSCRQQKEILWRNSVHKIQSWEYCVSFVKNMQHFDLWRHFKAIGGSRVKKVSKVYMKVLFDTALTPQTALQNNRRFPRYVLPTFRDLKVYIGESAQKMDLNCYNVVISNQRNSKLFLTFSKK